MCRALPFVLFVLNQSLTVRLCLTGGSQGRYCPKQTEPLTMAKWGMVRVSIGKNESDLVKLLAFIYIIRMSMYIFWDKCEHVASVFN